MTTNSEQIDWGHWILRLVAFIIDTIIISIVAGIILFIAAIGIVFGGFFVGFGYFLLFWLIDGILYVLYFTIFDAYWGATLGKRFLGLQVQMVNGGKVPFDKSLIRNLSKFFGLVIIDWLIGILTPGDKRQKFSDRYAGTIVVQTKQSFASAAVPPPPPPPPPA
jgi:uncharacterized RDD family membrane protein YckC